MTDVFISYKREERDQARALAQALGAGGYSVWWDAEILPGEQYRAVTLQILESCRAAIVIWSPRSTSSNWVLDEAQRALDRGVLVPVHLEPLTAYPLGFGQVHAHDLVGWDGAPNDAKFQPVLAAVKRLVGAHGRAIAQPRSPAEAEAEIAFWRGVQDSRDADDLQAYLDRYGDGLFADLARRKLAALDEAEAKPRPTRKRASRAKIPAAEAASGAPSIQPLYQAPSPSQGGPQTAPPPRKLSFDEIKAGGFTRWELSFIAGVALLSPFILWPIVNMTIAGMEVFWPDDHLRLLDITQWRNVFVLAPVLTAIAWGHDFAERWIEAESSAQIKRMLRYAVFAILAVLYVMNMRAREDYAAHSMAWLAAVLVAALVARRAGPALQRLVSQFTSKQA